MVQQSFSKRNQCNVAKEITIREAAPENLRYFILETVREMGFTPAMLRANLCSVLRVRPDPNNWSDYPNIWDEVEERLYGCDWYRVYDFIEALYAHMKESDDDTDNTNAPKFSKAMNDFFVEEGIGWQLVKGHIITRGTETFETVVTKGTTALKDSERPTAAKHLYEALQDLSRRPAALCTYLTGRQS